MNDKCNHNWVFNEYIFTTQYEQQYKCGYCGKKVMGIDIRPELNNRVNDEIKLYGIDTTGMKAYEVRNALIEARKIY